MDKAGGVLIGKLPVVGGFKLRGSRNIREVGVAIAVNDTRIGEKSQQLRLQGSDI